MIRHINTAFFVLFFLNCIFFLSLCGCSLELISEREKAGEKSFQAIDAEGFLRSDMQMKARSAARCD